MVGTSELSGLPVGKPDDRGVGSRWLAATLAGQLVVLLFALGGAFAPAIPAAAAVPVLGLSAAAVVEPGNGGEAGSLSTSTEWPAGSRVQLTFQADQEGWAAVLWFDGPDSMVPLYPSPAKGETGMTAADAPYVLPSDGAFLRLTPTGPGGDFVAVVAATDPDPEIVGVMLDPQPRTVRALRDRLEREAAARVEAPGAVERYLQTADGRGVPVPWDEVRGTGRLVLGWGVEVR